MERYETLKDEIKEFYFRKDLLKFFQFFGQDREVVPVYKGEVFAPRPSVLIYDTDYKLAVNDGATSFHASLEKWRSVVALKDIGDDRRKLNDNRLGWDLLFDIDSKVDIDASKYVAKLIVDLLMDVFDVSNIYVKFSGSRGFHIAVNGNSFPSYVDDTPIYELYPELMQKIATYIKGTLKEDIREYLKNRGIVAQNPYEYIEIEDNWSYRHLFRMPYSLNEKTWNVSLPLKLDELEDFEPSMAKISSVSKIYSFMDRYKEGELELLVYEAIDYWEKKGYEEYLNERAKKATSKVLDEGYEEYSNYKASLSKYSNSKGFSLYVEEEFFPNTIKNILAGLKDGRKRAVFILINFLRKVNWSWEEIEQKLNEWNAKNEEPLKESYIRTQLKYFKKNEQRLKDVLPPNFENDAYYKDIGVFDKHDLELGVKNPVTYAYKKKLMVLKRGGIYKNNNNRNTRNRKNFSS